VVTQRRDFGAQLGHLIFEGQDVSDSFEIHTGIHQLCNAMESSNVGLAVPAIATLGASWLQQPNAFVISQRLRVHTR
jgi:hypothetical protein